jgi:Fe-S cluster assembly iron-binding protein IscA
MITLTPKAVAKVKEIMDAQDPKPVALRLGVQGGGCSGFSYSMQFENEKGAMDKVFVYPVPRESLAAVQGIVDNPDEKLVILVDPISIMYLEGVTVDYLETLEASGFKFDNPNVKSTCGCGQSFSA